MQEIGEIVADKEKKVIVKVVRNSACSKCDKDCSLAGESDQDEIKIELDKNSFNLKKGQKVLIEMGGTRVVLSALIVYLFPLISMIIGYFASFYILGFFNINVGEAAGVIGSGIFLLLSFYFIKKINNKIQGNKKFQPQIIKKIE